MDTVVKESQQVKKRAKEGLVILILGLAAFLMMSLLSFDAKDPSWIFSGTNNKIMNAGGKSGAWIASILLSFLGYLAFILPLVITGLSILVLRTEPSSLSRGMKALRIVSFLLCLATATALIALHYNDPKAYLAGGYLGQFIASVFQPLFGLLGTTLILLVVFFSCVTISTGFSWLVLMETIGRYTLNALAFVQTLVKTQMARLREKRKTVVAEVPKPSKPPMLKKLVKPKPPKIEPTIKPVALSDRAEKEKQKQLFDDPLIGDMPALNLLDEPGEKINTFSPEDLEATARLLEAKLADFNIKAEVVSVNPGPVITRFELDLAPGIKVSKLTNLAKDLARSLSVVSVRVVEVIPGKSFVGIEIPNESREVVRLSEVVSAPVFDKAKSVLTMALGKDISGNPMVVDLAKMPHCLVAGTTGSGKSVGLNAMILSLLYKSTPEDLRMIMIDPKMLELSVYEGIPHLLTPVVTDMKEAANALRWGVGEMERRYRLMAALGVRNLAGFNRKLAEASRSGDPIKDPLWRPEDSLEDEAPLLEPLPAIVIVIDELADLMMIVGKKVEELIARIAQKARAAGIHLLLATQRPSVDVLTGLIKANIPTRIAFQVSSKVDSRTILDQGGAEQLLGQGDMLYQPAGTSVPTRIHGAFVDDHEVHNVVADWKKRGDPDYIEDILEGRVDAQTVIPGESPSQSEGEQDPLYDEAVMIVTESRKASISGVQRRLKIGYNRAARMIEEMEAAGVVSAMQSNGSREVLAPPPIKE